MPISEIISHPSQAQQRQIKEKTPIWETLKNEFGDKHMRVQAARKFDQPGKNRDFKLGSSLNWVLNFFDSSGPSAYSRIMNLNLTKESTGYTEGYQNLV